MKPEFSVSNVRDIPQIAYLLFDRISDILYYAMDTGSSRFDRRKRSAPFAGRLYRYLAPRAYSAIIFAALFCTLAVKLFHSWRNNLLGEYFDWILADISFLLIIEVALALICFAWPRRWVIRTATVIAAIVCTWSVINAGWLIRTGTQIIPSVVLSLLRDPVNTLRMVGDNLIRMPAAATILLGPSAIALAFFFSVLARPQSANYRRKHITRKVLVSAAVILVTVTARWGAASSGSVAPVSEELRYNCQFRAIMGLVPSKSARLTTQDLANANRRIPTLDDFHIGLSQRKQQPPYNVLVIILEGVQYSYTSLATRQNNLTPCLATLADQGVEFTNTRTSLSHTTKALFGLLTGCFPSASHDIIEAVPAEKPFPGLAAILKSRLRFRTAFFQSAKGDFESRPALVHNLGFDKFWARDDLNDPNVFLGSLGSDEFSMLEAVTDWIEEGEEPFFLTILCSVTHDSYEVPEWFAEWAREPVERYKLAISYTDRFLAAVDAELAGLNLTDKTILCVVGDHGEAFGEHGLHGHERIAFEEVLRIPWIIRAPALIKPATKITQPASSIDLTPTLLALLGFDARAADFDGIDALGPIPQDRKVYFSDWKHEGPAGFIKGGKKFVYCPASQKVSLYDLNTDPNELFRMELPQQKQLSIADEIIQWRKRTVFRSGPQHAGNQTLYGRWVCRWRWKNRGCSVKYRPPEAR